jgi:hypothetical protein
MTTTAITKRKPETNTGAHDKEPTSKRSTPSTADTEQNKHMLAQAPVRRDADTNTKAQLSPLAYVLRTFSEASTATQRGCRTASSLLRRFRKLPLPTNTRFAFAEETLCEYSVRCTGGLCTDAPSNAALTHATCTIGYTLHHSRCDSEGPNPLLTHFPFEPSTGATRSANPRDNSCPRHPGDKREAG